MLPSFLRPAASLALFTLVLSLADAAGQSLWNAGNSNWQNANRWTPAGVPDGTTDAEINNGGTSRVQGGAGEQHAQSLTLGRAAGESGYLQVNGNGNNLIVHDEIVVGLAGMGGVELSGRGRFSAQNAIFGQAAGSRGDLSVSDDESRFFISGGGDLTIGDTGESQVMISNGGFTFVLGDTTLGTGATGRGEVAVDGADSVLHVRDAFSVGQGGFGSLSITDGGVARLGQVSIGSEAGSTGWVRVDGEGSRLSIWTDPAPFGSADVTVGERGDGVLILSGDGSLGQDNLVQVASEAGSTGTIYIGGDAILGPLAPGRISAPGVNGGAGDANLVFNHNDYFDFTNAFGAPVLVGGSLNVVHEAGRTVLHGGLNAYTGTTKVKGGTLVLVGGEISQTSLIQIGNEVGKEGTLTVSGGTLTTPGQLMVGNAGLGVLDVGYGGIVRADSLVSAIAPNGGYGTIFVRGQDSRLEIASEMLVGVLDEARLSLLDQGAALTMDLTAGSSTNAYGRISVGDSLGGGTLTVQNDMILGDQGSGRLEVYGDQSFASVGGSAVLGKDISGSGTVSLGQGAHWDSMGAVLVGDSGSGRISIAGGSSVDLNSMSLGYDQGSRGVGNIFDDGSALRVDNLLEIGRNGEGELQFLSGTEATVGSLDIASGEYGTGVLRVSGSDTHFEVTSGFARVGLQGDGTLMVNEGAKLTLTTFTAPQALLVGLFPDSTGLVEIRGGEIPGVIDAIGVHGGLGEATLKFQHGGDNYYFSDDGTRTGTPLTIDGSIGIEHWAGHTNLSGVNTSTGDTVVSGGRLSTRIGYALGRGQVFLKGGRCKPEFRFGSMI